MGNIVQGAREVPEKIYGKLYGHARAAVANLARRYARQCLNKAAAGEDDLSQQAWLAVWQWVLEEPNRVTAAALLEDPVQAIKFISRMAQCRMCDHLDVWAAGARGQTRTVRESESSPEHASIFDLMGSPDPASLAPLRESLHRWQSKMILDLLANPPESLLESLRGVRGGCILGPCRAYWNTEVRRKRSHKHPELGFSSIALGSGEGKTPKIQEIILHRPLSVGAVMTKRFPQTTLGPARARWAPRENYTPDPDKAAQYRALKRLRALGMTDVPLSEVEPTRADYQGDGWADRNMEIRWPFSGLIVSLNVSGRLSGRTGISGTYAWETLRPRNQLAYSINALEAHTGLPKHAVRRSLEELHDKLTARTGPLRADELA